MFLLFVSCTLATCTPWVLFQAVITVVHCRYVSYYLAFPSVGIPSVCRTRGGRSPPYANPPELQKPMRRRSECLRKLVVARAFLARAEARLRGVGTPFADRPRRLGAVVGVRRPAFDDRSRREKRSIKRGCPPCVYGDRLTSSLFFAVFYFCAVTVACSCSRLAGSLPPLDLQGNRYLCIVECRKMIADEMVELSVYRSAKT